MWLITLAAAALTGQIETLPDEMLGTAPVQLEVDKQKVHLHAFLWRDFMPIAPADGKPLVAVVALAGADRKPLPQGLTIDKVWVLRGKETWSAGAKEMRNNNKPSWRMEVVLRNGPKWQPGAEVDVLAKVRDAQAKTHWLRAPKQKIQRTE